MRRVVTDEAGALPENPQDHAVLWALISCSLRISEFWFSRYLNSGSDLEEGA